MYGFLIILPVMACTNSESSNQTKLHHEKGGGELSTTFNQEIPLLANSDEPQVWLKTCIGGWSCTRDDQFICLVVLTTVSCRLT